jgi:flagellar biosynthesis activator protein FlaF
MNAHTSYVAYARSGATGRDARAVEYDAFARVTQRMKTASTLRDGQFAALAQAMADNQRLWSTLAEDVALPTNTLPPRLREGIFYLYQFTRQHSRRILDGAATVEALIDINAAVMRGLRGDRGTE